MSPTDSRLPGRESAEPLLQVRGLRKYFPVPAGWLAAPQQLRAVDGVDLDIATGQTLGLVGESGCGKSTLGRAILQLQPPDAGEVRLAGQNIVGLRPAERKAMRREMQIIFQDPYASLSPRRTVAQIIREPLDVHQVGTPAERRERVDELLDTVGLRADVLDRYPHEFSGGQRQRIGIARALALEPRFIVADEPVSALDVSVQSQVLNLLARLQSEHGIAFLFISHDLAVIQHISEVIAVMYLGKIVEQAPAFELYAQPLHPYTQALLSAVPLPDPRARRQRVPLKGEVPSALQPPSGCAFHTRCPLAAERCRVETPVLRDAGSGHQVACHFAPG
ncbi:MAG: dipeptide ABC transporter ATP-binding protein [Gammaproteobacteria bacterium]|jgi:oligopeptide transport system ATP-binding protein|nr:dipeptide ABC transporter ATP-binding protein [Gammaproteobacteria bacterium]